MSETTSVETVKPKAITQAWKDFVTKNVPAIESAMPRIGITAESVARTALSQMYRNPQLLECDRMSVMRAIVEAASLGLTFALGRAYLVPFNNKVKGVDGKPDTWRKEAQLIPGYQGLVDLVRRSTGVKSVIANAVYEGDDFNYSAGLTEDTFFHRSLVEPQDAKLTHAYCIIRFLDGGYQWVVLTKKQIDAVRARSKAGNFGPWVTDYAAMAIKTAVRRCTKLCPASIELVRALELDTRADMGEPQELAVDIELGEEMPAQPEPATTATARVADRLKKQKPAPPPAQDDAAADAVKAITERITFDMLDLAKGSRSAADVLLSEATGGKIQKLDDLEAAITEKPGWAEMIDAFVIRRTEGGGE